MIGYRHNPHDLYSIAKAVESAIRYVEAGIRTSSPLGKGNGPINHFHSMMAKPSEETKMESSLRRSVYGEDY